MAEPTQTPGDRYTDDSHNPAKELSDRELNSAVKPQNGRDESSAGTDSENLRNREEKPQSATADTAANLATSAVSRVNPLLGGALKVTGFFRTKKGAATGGAAGLLIALITAVVFLAPGGILLNLKENGFRWMSKYQELGHSSRVRQQLKSKYFANPDDCKGYKITCRYKSGITEVEAQKLRDSGFRNVETNTAKNGKLFITSMEYTDKDGKTRSVTASNWENLHKNEPSFRSLVNQTVNPRAIGFRSKASLSKFNQFGVDRSKPLGDDTTRESLIKKFRTYVYSSSGGDSRLGRGSADGDQRTDEALKNLGELDGVITEEAEKMRADIIENGPNPSIVPDASDLTSASALEGLAKGGVTGGIKGTVMGFFAGIDSYCSIYKTVRIVSYGAKVYAAASLIKYAALFMTVADMSKAGDANPGQVAFIAGILLKPSSLKGSKGMDFSNSEGAHLIFQNKVSNPGGLARFSVGTTAMKALSEIQSTMNSKGVSADTCRQVKSWWGQLLLGVGGLVICAATAGGGCVAGAGQGVLIGAIMGYVTNLLTPILIRYAAGAVVPDASTDPEGGYGAGNAIAAGLGAFGGQLGAANGSKPLTTAEFALLNASSSNEQATVAAVDQINDQSAGLFNSNNPMSFQNRLAVAISPLLNSSPSVASYATSAGSMVTNSFSSIPSLISPQAFASPTDDYRGEYCVDEDIIATKVAHDAFCNPIHGPDPGTYDNPAFTPELVAHYMADNNFIDQETGEVTSDDYQDFLNACTGADGQIHPLTADGYGIDIEAGGLDTSQCISNDEKYKYFWLYTEDSAMFSGVEDSLNDTLGKSDGSGLPTPDTSSAVGSNVQSLAKQLLDLEAAGKISLDGYSDNRTSDTRDRSMPRLQLEDAAAGKTANLSTRCSYASGLPKSVALQSQILQFLVDLGGRTSYTVNSLAGQCHSGPGSNHHKGAAVDFACQLNVALANSSGAKYGVSRNDEGCPGDGHYHYSIGGN